MYKHKEERQDGAPPCHKVCKLHIQVMRGETWPVLRVNGSSVLTAPAELVTIIMAATLHQAQFATPPHGDVYKHEST